MYYALLYSLSVHPLGYYLNRSGRQYDLRPDGGAYLGLRKGNGEEGMGSDYGHNRVSGRGMITALTAVHFLCLLHHKKHRNRVN